MRFDCELTIDDVRLDSEHVRSYQESLGWIPQLPQLAPGTIRDQFQLVMPGITDGEITNKLAELALELSELPFGLDTQLGGSDEKSSQLSGGQIRKIAVARALIRTPFLIVADEPTADLDSHSAAVIMNALRRAVEEGAALICISHDSDIRFDGARTMAVERVIA
jgi:ABC-type transport system involved in cytochrome bd biosynthesis fused ATPase/permease subunit